MTTSKKFIAAVAALSLVAAACGDDDEDSSTDDDRPTATEPRLDRGTVDRGAFDRSAFDGSAVDRGTVDRGARHALDLDTNGDGTVVFGIAAAGPRDDGGYYQALVDKAIAVSEENGYGDPIVVDNITTEDAATELANLAEQGVDTIFVGASEIADPLTDLIAQYPDIFWYCNCGAGYPENPGLAQSQDDSSEISYTAGYATGSAAAGVGRRQRRVHRVLRPQLREGGLPGLRARPEGGRRRASR